MNFSLRRFGLLLCLVAFLSSNVCLGRYARPDLEKVPVQRIVENLEQLAKEDAKNADLRVNLARAHAMAFALNASDAEVNKRDPSSGAWFGYEPAHVPFQVMSTEDMDQIVKSKKHLKEAIKWYEEALKIDSKNLTAAIGLAWCIEQSGETEKAIAEYRKVIELAWKSEKEMMLAGLGWHSVTAEAASYLIPLLDAKKDAAEIKELEARTEKLSQLPRPVTPIAIPLGDKLSASELIDSKASVAFDADGTGLQKRWSWINSDAGWLVSDKKRTGEIESALQMFGSVTFWMFWENGYSAMASLDDNRDGQLSGKELDGLYVWHDENQNGLSDEGELLELADLKIVSISTRGSSKGTPAGTVAFCNEGVRFADGSTKPTYDVVLEPR